MLLRESRGHLVNIGPAAALCGVAVEIGAVEAQRFVIMIQFDYSLPVGSHDAEGAVGRAFPADFEFHLVLRVALGQRVKSIIDAHFGSVRLALAELERVFFLREQTVGVHDVAVGGSL